jgi:KDO2-lipid IV(A) lauroyltransferase
LIDYIAYIAVRLLNKIFSLVPVSASLWLGRRIGTAAFLVNKKRRVVAYANLKAAFAKEKSPRELKGITKKVYQNLVQTFVEILNMTKVSRAYNNRYVEVVNMERIRNASKSGRGTILLTGHFGNWELSNLTSAIEGFPILVLAREQKMRRLNELLNRLRELKGCKVVRKGMPTKNLIKALRENRMVGILSDQDAGRDGVFVDFFGRPTSTHAGPMDIARHTDSIILPNFIVRTKGPYHKLYLEEYIDFRDLKGEAPVKAALQKFTSLLEGYVRRYPDQWLWLHKRWKSTPVRTVLVLNDGRSGHLNQSLAVAQALQKARTTQGYTYEDTKIEVVDVKYKNGLARKALTLCASFATWRCHGCMRCMRLCLETKCYDRLMATYSEFIVSCGSSLAPVNIFIAAENNAKNIVIMKPGVPFGLRKFKLVLMPKHDGSLKAKNVVNTTLAPNMIDDSMLKRQSSEIGKITGLSGSNALGVFIGGDNPEFSISRELAESLVDEIARFSSEHDADILVTTSRRTSGAVEGAIKEGLKGNSRLRLLVIANEKNIDRAVGGILGLSKVALVSGESISMVSEAISSGRRVVAFMPEKRVKGITKHEMALKALADEGYLTVSSVDGLYEELVRVWKSGKPPAEVKDREAIFAAVRRLI